MKSAAAHVELHAASAQREAGPASAKPTGSFTIEQVDRLRGERARLSVLLSVEGGVSLADGDRVGVSLEYVPHVMDTSTGRPTGQRGFQAWWRTGADVANVNAFRVLKL